MKAERVQTGHRGSPAVRKSIGALFHPSPFILYPLLVLLPLLFAFVAAQFAAAPALTVGTRDGRVLAGVNDVERIGGRVVRWTNGNALLTLPRTTSASPLLLDLGLLNARPPNQPEPQVELGADGLTPVRFALPRSLSGEGRRYRLLLPSSLGVQAQVQIASDKMLLPADPRPLGVVITGATLAPASAGLRVPSPLALAALALIGLCLAAGLRAVGLRSLPTLAIVAAATSGLAWGGAAHPTEVLPFLPRLAALGLLAYGTIALAWLLSADFRFSIFDFGGAAIHNSKSKIQNLPIYMGLAWWAMPAYQLIMLADGSRPAIAPQTLIIGVFVVVGLAVLAAVRLVTGRVVAPHTVALLLAASLAHGAYLVWYAYTRSAPDFWIHFKGARGFIRDGLPLYDIPSIQANHFGFAYKWPPLYAALLAPFVSQAGEVVLLGHRIMNTVLLIATAGILVREAITANRDKTPTKPSSFILHPSSFTLAAVLLLFNYRPATDTIALGQFDIIALFCCVLAWALLRRGRDGWAGALIAFLALIKLYPVLLLGFFIAARRWRALAGFALGGLACTAYSVAVLGWQNHVTYLTDVVTRIGGGTSWIENQTFNGFASRLFDPTIAADKFDYAPVTLATYAFFAGTVGLAALLTYKLKTENVTLKKGAVAATTSAPKHSVIDDAFSMLNAQCSICFGLFVILMIVAVPAAWMHYEAALILPFALLLIYGGDAISPGRAAALALAYALISYGNQWSFFNGEVLGGLSILGYSYKFYGMLLLFGASVSTLLATRRELQRIERTKQIELKGGLAVGQAVTRFTH